MKATSPRMLLALAMLASVHANSVPLPNKWTKLALPPAVTAVGARLASQYVTRDGVYEFFSSRNGLYRVLSSEVEASPQSYSNWKSWTALGGSSFPRATTGGFQEIYTWSED